MICATRSIGASNSRSETAKDAPRPKAVIRSEIFPGAGFYRGLPPSLPALEAQQLARAMEDYPEIDPVAARAVGLG